MSVADGPRTDTVRALVDAELAKRQRGEQVVETKLVCPKGCGKTYLTVHESDELGHLCPKAPIGRRLVWLVPAPPEEVK